jgi:hypothetical protein
VFHNDRLISLFSRLAKVLIPMLLNCWLDSGPAELRPSGAELSAMRRALETLLAAVRLLQRLDAVRLEALGGNDANNDNDNNNDCDDNGGGGGGGADSAVDTLRSGAELAAQLRAICLADVERYVCAYFPLVGVGSDDPFDVANCDDARLAINVRVAQLLVAFVPSSRRHTFLPDVVRFVAAALQRRANAERSLLLAPLLGVVETLLVALPLDSPLRLPLVRAFAQHIEALPIASSGKRRAVALLARSLRSLDANTPLAERQCWTKCVLLLPRLLWQLKTSYQNTSRVSFGVCRNRLCIC